MQELLQFCFFLVSHNQGGGERPPCPPISAGHWEKEECCKRNNNSWQPCLRPFVRWKLFFNFSQFYTQVYFTQWIQIRIRYYYLAFKTKVDIDVVFCILAFNNHAKRSVNLESNLWSPGFSQKTNETHYPKHFFYSGQ